jgi:hypothetical protein
MKNILALAAILSLLSACAVHTRSGSVVVDPHTHSKPSGNGGGFCPPGQAKKGNC